MKLTKKMLLGLPTTFCGNWSCIKDLERDFKETIGKEVRILFAWYSYAGYSGSAYVLGYDKSLNKFFEVHGGHCSCYGLEGQWSPEYCIPKELQEILQRRSEASWRSSYDPAEFKDWLTVKVQ